MNSRKQVFYDIVAMSDGKFMEANLQSGMLFLHTIRSKHFKFSDSSFMHQSPTSTLHMYSSNSTFTFYKIFYQIREILDLFNLWVSNTAIRSFLKQIVLFLGNFVQCWN